MKINELKKKVELELWSVFHPLGEIHDEIEEMLADLEWVIEMKTKYIKGLADSFNEAASEVELTTTGIYNEIHDFIAKNEDLTDDEVEELDSWADDIDNTFCEEWYFEGARVYAQSADFTRVEDLPELEV